MARRKSDWSELYPELLTSISGRLKTLDDFRHFRSVCKKWRSSIVHIPKNLPILSPLLPHKFTTHSQIIVANTTFLLQPLQIPNPNPNSPKPWLITVEELNPGTLILRKPLRRSTIDELPENFPRVLDVSDYSVTEISKAYNFRCSGKFGKEIRRITKVVMFSNPACAFPSADDCYVLVLHDNGCLLCFGLKDEDYGYLRYSRVSCFDDIVNYKGLIWAIDRKGRVYVIRYNRNGLKLGLFSNDSVCTGYVGDTLKRLVESSDGLYLIDRYHYDELIKFRVYKLNEVERKWNEVKSLDGRILFVATDCCFFVSAEDLPGFGRNCIVFPKDHFPVYSGSTHPDNFYFKGAIKELEIGVFHLDDGESGLVSTYPGYSDILWPPPKWIFPDAVSSECTPEVQCGEEMCPSPLASETMSQASEDPSTIDGLDQPDESDAWNMGEAAPWSDIPSALLTEIAMHLRTRIDICLFRAVCNKWRTSTPAPQSLNLLSSLFPLKISVNMTPFIDMASRSTASQSLVLVASTVYLLQQCDHSSIPPKSWLVTVEEMKPGKLFLRLPLRRDAIKKLPENFPKVLNFSDFHVSEIGKEYNFHHANSSWGTSNWFTSPSSHKVVLFPNSACASSTIDDITAFVLYDRGNLVLFRLTDKDLLHVRYGVVTKFDDIVNFKGNIFAIDRRGRVYVISGGACTISRITGDAMGIGHGPDRRKRLVVSDGKLYLLVRSSPEDKIYFRVYKLNEELHKWDEVTSLGDKVLFVTPMVCFVASARDFPGWKGNCVVFPADCLPTYSGSTYPDWRFFRRTIKELEIGVFHLGDNDGARLIKSYPGYSDLFWPPPAWLQSLECPSRSEEEQMYFPCKHSQEDQISLHLPDYAEGHRGETSTISSQQDITIGRTAASDLTHALTSLVQASKEGTSTVKFQGVDVRSELVPILQKIWATYGNIAKGSAVRSPGTVARALESLAEAVSILKSTPARLLDQSQTDTLRAALFDLRLKQFRVGWLSPFIGKACACQRMNQLVSTKARLLDMKRKLDEMEHAVDNDTRSFANDMNTLGAIDFEKCLGEGLC